jgi:predicted RNase H-like HicB family nuclease
LIETRRLFFASIRYPHLERGGSAVKYRVRLIKTNGGYAIWVPVLPGCRSYGRTEDEALENIKSAILSYLEALEEQSTNFECREVDVSS